MLPVMACGWWNTSHSWTTSSCSDTWWKEAKHHYETPQPEDKENLLKDWGRGWPRSHTEKKSRKGKSQKTAERPLTADLQPES